MVTDMRGEWFTGFAEAPNGDLFVAGDYDVFPDEGLCYLYRVENSGAVSLFLEEDQAVLGGDGSVGISAAIRQSGGVLLHYHPPVGTRVVQESGIDEGEISFGPLGPPIKADGESPVFPDVPDGGRARQIFRARLLN